MFNILKKKLQKGQALVFFAVAVPTLFMFAAATAEFGWWFINQSRLQNAADAAVLAGADTFVSGATQNIKATFVNKIPDAYSDLQSEAQANAVAKNYADKNFHFASDAEDTSAAYYNSFDAHSYRRPKVDTNTNTNFEKFYYAVELEGKAKHLFGILDDFGEMNLKAVAVTEIEWNKGGSGGGGGGDGGILDLLKVSNVMIGNWEVQNIYQNINIYEKNTDGTQKLNTDGTIKYSYKNKRTEFQNATGYETLFTGKWNHYQEPDKKIYYTKDDEFRTEIVDVYVTRDLKKQTTYTKDEETYYIEYGSAIGTKANKSGELKEDDLYKDDGNVYSWRNVESINLDWAQDFEIQLKDGVDYSVNDWDIGYAFPEDISIKSIKGNNKSDKAWKDKQLNHRIHGLITFYEVFPSIAKKLNEKGEVDEEKGEYYYEPLWIRIESEPMWSYLGKKQLQLDSVHQIIININESNWMDEEKDGQPKPIDKNDTRLKNFQLEEDEKVILRPLVFFYDGPETNATNIFFDKAKINSYNGQTRPSVRTVCRNSKPVILNLNADFAGILYMPNSPVCLVTNGHKFKGFIRAQSYKELATMDDLIGETITQKIDSYKNYNNETLKLPELFMHTVVYNPSGTDPNGWDREVHGEIYFKDTDKLTVEKSLPKGSTYSIFNISELKDTFFDAPHPYTIDEEHGTIIMTAD